MTTPRAPAPFDHTVRDPETLIAATQNLVTAATTDVNNPSVAPEIREAANEIVERQSPLLTYVSMLESKPHPVPLEEACSATMQVAAANKIRLDQTNQSNRDAHDEAAYYHTFAVGLVLTTMVIAAAGGPLAVRRQQIADEILTSANLTDDIKADFPKYRWFFISKMHDPDQMSRAARIVALERAAFPNLDTNRKGDFLNALDAILDEDGKSFDKERIRELSLIHTKGGEPEISTTIQTEEFEKLFYPFGTKNDGEVSQAITTLFGEEDAQEALVKEARQGGTDKIPIQKLPELPLDADALKNTRVYRAGVTDPGTVIDKNILKFGVKSYYLIGALAVGAAVGAAATTIKSISAKNRLTSVTADDGSTTTTSAAVETDSEFPPALSYLGKQFVEYCQKVLTNVSVVE